MIFGTAGFTAGMSIFKLARTIKPGHGNIIVTGGVRSPAAVILFHLGHSVTAVSGKTDTTFLKKLGKNHQCDQCGEEIDFTSCTYDAG